MHECNHYQKLGLSHRNDNQNSPIGKYLNYVHPCKLDRLRDIIHINVGRHERGYKYE